MIIVPPSHCPACGSKTAFIKDQLFCSNNDCEARVNKKVIKFCKVFGVKGLGERQVEKFEFESLFDALQILVNVSLDELALTLGSVVTAKKIHIQLGAIKQAVDTATLIEALSIPTIGTVQSKKLVPFFPDNVLKAGLGEVATTNTLNWLEENQNILGLFTLKVETPPVTGLIPVAITGKLNNKLTKAKATEELRKLGYEVKSSLTKETKFLICDTDQTSSNCEKARNYNIPIITYISLIEGIK